MPSPPGPGAPAPSHQQQVDTGAAQIGQQQVDAGAVQTGQHENLADRIRTLEDRVDELKRKDLNWKRQIAEMLTRMGM